jgi:hypothetical protein
MEARFKSYGEFWPFYVSQHLDPTNRALHVVGTAGVHACLLLAVALTPLWLLAMPLVGYGFAWVGHFAFEKNRPATFSYPGWSLRGDFQMFWTTLLGRMAAELEEARRLFPRAA